MVGGVGEQMDKTGTNLLSQESRILSHFPGKQGPIENPVYMFWDSTQKGYVSVGL